VLFSLVSVIVTIASEFSLVSVIVTIASEFSVFSVRVPAVLRPAFSGLDALVGLVNLALLA